MKDLRQCTFPIARVQVIGTYLALFSVILVILVNIAFKGKVPR